MRDIRQWRESLGLVQYADSFEENLDLRLQGQAGPEVGGDRGREPGGSIDT
jgi:hypothetical protein